MISLSAQLIVFDGMPDRRSDGQDCVDEQARKGQGAQPTTNTFKVTVLVVVLSILLSVGET